eukprot:511555-Pelagomonas_calceolata.AAC.1
MVLQAVEEKAKETRNASAELALLRHAVVNPAHRTCRRDVRDGALVRDGSMRYRVFDPCAVRIHVEEGYGHRRQLVLELISREQLQEAEQMVA